MDHQGTSPTGEHPNHLKQESSPQPSSYQDDINPANLGLGINNGNLQEQYSSGQFSQGQTLPVFETNVEQNQQFSQGNIGEPLYALSQNQNAQPEFQQQFDGNQQYQNQEFNYSNNFLGVNNYNGGDFSLYPNPQTQNEIYDPSLYLNDSPQPSVNPADLIGDISSPPHHTPTPPQMLTAELPQTSSAQHSPSFNQHQFPRSPGHSRTASLQPESAQFPNAQLPTDWGMIPQQFKTHRKTPSEYSDVSASSVAPSPNLGLHDSFDTTDQRHSPLVHPQDQGIYQDLGAMGNFSISDPHHGTSPLNGRSPAHSPQPSPRLDPQQMGQMNQQSPFMLSMNMPNNGYIQQPTLDMYGQQQFKQENFGEMGQEQQGQGPQMPPPDINIEFAPASRQNSFPVKAPLDQDALTPPQRGRRPRASSDITGTGLSQFSRQGTPSNLGPGSDRGSSPPGRSLSPLDRAGASTPGHRRRQSTSAIPNQRDYILGLADPEYQAASGSAENGNPKRVQKHPATFQCTLCPKRFTRAYNLRSHLRTHTDERPFVCTVCSKAFARQHDRKRHEGLHSGEKKFVCKGELKQGGQWGCGRRFARADALGRHFRSEAGRICIKPLLDEEHIERQRLWHEQHMAQNMQQQQPLPPQSMDANGFPMDASGNYTLPAALLAQYPALAGLSWADLPQGDAMEDDVSGRSSFDASGSEYYDEGDEGGYVSGPGTGFTQGQMPDGYRVDYASDYGGGGGR
ncbi:DNA-binding transcription factor [Pseudogymnoascus verrucosus]|uniref:DNA-binding transcription factor n=1 Tax=Pseudogymnoascus verrucosus TaxID=342668 RepID=A0A1B8GSA7_9PEZI|nr:DNA-binding transcription factor [Pseudogymnoascus verrucosus]OBT98705.1 DNA-binding transcription factor [Pseudogymnoascus verrucosus]